MLKTQQQAEKAAQKACKEILKIILKADEIHKIRKRVTKIIKKHLIDCYIASWITEAEQIEDAPASFLWRLRNIELYGPDEELIAEAFEYVNSIPVSDETLPRRIFGKEFYPPVDPVDYYVLKNIIKFLGQMEQIKIIKNKYEREQLIAWRTGIHGESGLGYRLTTLVRSESDTAQANACISVYKEADIFAYRFNAIMDDKTCNKCKELNNKIFFIQDKKEGINFPPIHPNCRCTIEPISTRNFRVQPYTRRYKGEKDIYKPADA